METAKKPKKESKTKSVLVGTIFATPLIRVRNMNISQTETNITNSFDSNERIRDPKTMNPPKAGSCLTVVFDVYPSKPLWPKDC